MVLIACLGFQILQSFTYLDGKKFTGIFFFFIIFLTNFIVEICSYSTFLSFLCRGGIISETWLLMVCLTILSDSDYHWMVGWWWTVNWKRCGRKLSWPSLRCHPGMTKENHEKYRWALSHTRYELVSKPHHPILFLRCSTFRSSE
jgi:hypothetical protein